MIKLTKNASFCENAFKTCVHRKVRKAWEVNIG